MTISIITPWYAETIDLIPDYAAATRGAEVVAVDNATPPRTAEALRLTAAAQGWAYLRNEANAGFAGGNNQGFERAAGDIIVFLNSDVAAPPAFLECVAHDVRDGALYGPSLGHQLVAGRWLPYLEGWCVAATRATWERLAPLVAGVRVGPWDAAAFPGPYWEDNDLCLRAMQAGVGLVQTAWPVQHKQGRSAGPITRWGAAFEANRATFGQRALAALAAPQDSPVRARLYAEMARQSDIQHHLGLLYSRARGVVVELGTRTGVSTAALLAGVEARGGRVTSIDIDDVGHLYAGHPQWSFVRGDSRSAETPWPGQPIDCLLIDTIHTYEFVCAELALWEPRVAPGGAILIHDTETFPGVRRAVEEYVAGRPDLRTTFVLPCNGMAVIEKGA